MKRIYDSIVQEYIASGEEMLFLSGPRQVGKTTVGLNAKNEDHRRIILALAIPVNGNRWGMRRFDCLWPNGI